MESKYKLVILNPYFGKLPEMFPYWLKTCGYNPTIDWIVFTDDVRAFDGTYEYMKPRNVRFIQMTLATVKAKAESVFGFFVPLNRPYKMCDFKPVYGLLFEDYITEYDFWAHGDMDVLYGNIRKFVTDEILDKYDRVYTNGYLSFYRNTDEVKNWYLTLEIKPGRENWKEVFSSEHNWEYDEWSGHLGGGITHIIEDNGKPMYMVKDWANILPGYGRLSYKDHGIEVHDAYFTVSKDGIFVYDRKTNGLVDEVSFIHMYRRLPSFKTQANVDTYYYLPPNIISGRNESTFVNTLVYHIKNHVVPNIRIKGGAFKQSVICKKK